MVHRSLNEAAYSIIKEKILHGEFKLGSRLREDLLAEEISMSRTPVREAINRLIADGFITKEAQKGLYLIDPDSQEIEDYIDIRIALEKLSVQQCIDRASDAEIAGIVEAVDVFADALDAEDYERCNQLDGEFHGMIADLTKNIKLITLLKDLSAFFQLVRSEEKKTLPKAKNQRTLREHRNIADAIAAKDVESAQELVAANIETMRINLYQKDDSEVQKETVGG